MAALSSSIVTSGATTMLHLWSTARMLLPIRFIPFVTVVQLFSVVLASGLLLPRANTVPASATLKIGKTVPVAAPPRRNWIILQVRQLQRLALESLLSWCEQWIIGGLHDIARLTAEAEQLVRTESFDLNADDPLSAIISELDTQISSFDQFVSRGRAAGLFSPFALMDQIRDDLGARSRPARKAPFEGWTGGRGRTQYA